MIAACNFYRVERGADNVMHPPGLRAGCGNRGFPFPADIARGNRLRAFPGAFPTDALRQPAILFVNNPQFPTVWRNKNEGPAGEPTNEGREK